MCMKLANSSKGKHIFKDLDYEIYIPSGGKRFTISNEKNGIRLIDLK